LVPSNAGHSSTLLIIIFASVCGGLCFSVIIIFLLRWLRTTRPNQDEVHADEASITGVVYDRLPVASSLQYGETSLVRNLVVEMKNTY